MKNILLPDNLPAQVLFDTNSNILHVTYSGELAPGKITQVSKFVAGCDFFTKNMSVLIDFSQSTIKTDVEATIAFLEYIQSIADQIGHPKWAIVSGSELNSAMLRRLIFLTENLPIDMQEFATTNEALQWLQA